MAVTRIQVSTSVHRAVRRIIENGSKRRIGDDLVANPEKAFQPETPAPDHTEYMVVAISIKIRRDPVVGGGECKFGEEKVLRAVGPV